MYLHKKGTVYFFFFFVKIEINCFTFLLLKKKKKNLTVYHATHSKRSILQIILLLSKVTNNLPTTPLPPSYFHKIDTLILIL